MESGIWKSPAFLQVKVTSSARFSFPLSVVFLHAIVSPSLLIPPALEKAPRFNVCEELEKFLFGLQHG